MAGLDTYRWWPNKLIKINVGGHEVQVDETFLKLTQEEQNQEVDKIAMSLHIEPPPSLRGPRARNDQAGIDFDALERDPSKADFPPPGYALDHPFNSAIWAATFIPPLALFLLGLCIAWILQGFRPKS
jgi:hypothetical protein